MKCDHHLLNIVLKKRRQTGLKVPFSKKVAGQLMINEPSEGARVTMPGLSRMNMCSYTNARPSPAAATIYARPSPASDWLVAGDQSLESTFASEMKSTLSFVLTGLFVCNN
jgi:hypothetical protein